MSVQHRRRRRSQLKGIDEINMTPLIDLTFLLLIVFMITMPIMEYGTDVVTPAMNSESLAEETSKSVGFRPGGIYVIEEMEMNEEQARSILARFYAENPDYLVLIRADGAASWSEVVDVVKMVKSVGFTRAKTVTTAE